ncbi:MAG: hypothetical protein COW52_00150 [Nitrospirae bacterium CG17_big_fil_post_rev_8_21_14_2_50_50_9]|nr:MAG: hypothetical protein COW52_00150 [Nitrospirae bacterium CG17_big_fil_post_rev_8_21_14_2_50_50_9]
MLNLYRQNKKEFWKLVRAGFWNRLTKFFGTITGKCSQRAYRLLYGEDAPPITSPLAGLRDDEVYVVVTILNGNVGIDGVVGNEDSVKIFLGRFPGAMYFVRRIDALKRSIQETITRSQVYISDRSSQWVQ